MGSSEAPRGYAPEVKRLLHVSLRHELQMSCGERICEAEQKRRPVWNWTAWSALHACATQWRFDAHGQEIFVVLTRVVNLEVDSVVHRSSYSRRQNRSEIFGLAFEKIRPNGELGDLGHTP